MAKMATNRPELDRESSHSLEKDSGSFLETHEVSVLKRQYMYNGLSSEDADFIIDMPSERQAKIYRKVDFRVVPMLALLYLIAHLDRANIGNAKIEGIEASLGLNDFGYNIAVSVFFAPYILCEIPSNMILVKFKRPSQYMAIIVTAWGLVMTGSAFVQNLGGLVACRILIGAFEAGFFPAAIYLISTWYPPHKTQFRTSIFYFSSAFSGAFSGLLAAGIAQLDGVGSLEGWRWIFLLEGLASVIIGIGVVFLLPDTPSLSNRWLQPDEQKFLNLTYQATRGGTIEQQTKGPKKQIHWSMLWSVLTDYHLYLQTFVFWSNTVSFPDEIGQVRTDRLKVPNYALKFSMPQIISNMGFTSTNAQLLSAPPYMVGAISAVIVGYFSDRTSKRVPFLAVAQAALIVGYSVLFVKAGNIDDNIALCYVMITLVCAGVYPIIPSCNTWTINNLAGAEKRSMGIAWLVTMGNCGGLIASFIFLEREKPEYPTGFGTSLAFGAAGLIASLLLAFSYRRHNKKYENWTKEQVTAKWSAQALEKLGDRSPFFKYSI